ncbi:GNAT family N-acetyltransferase [Virgibacillus soli]|uniref:GNAT family N-acetyltransferase n=1 Tax=Paracerasibacillus soli TaxID=480284 RepID=UPI0035F0D755
MSTIFREEGFDEFTVIQATESEISSITNLLKETAKWIQEKGINQWSYLLYGNGDGEIIKDIKLGKTYIVKDKHGKFAATFNISPQQNDWDIDMWGKRTDHAYYIHRLAVSGDYRRQQIGKRLLHWIIKNSDGIIRLDCVAHNTVLNKFYQDTGFALIGFRGEGDDTYSLYEKC